ncbi:MAG: glycosyltransferase family 2 protein [Lachnospiraceae bacterium]|nr:glycosyltransferase family 2 protein [Lachnospiraceae bacterium]
MQQFDWSAYYQAAFEREKKKNNVLAGKIADADSRIEELQFKTGRIVGNPFYRTMTMVEKAAKLPVRVLRHQSHKKAMQPASKELTESYEQELYAQTHPYYQWLRIHEKTAAKSREEEKTVWNKITDKCRVITFSELQQFTSLREIEGEYLLFLEDNSVLASFAGKRITQYLDSHREISLLYGDEDCFTGEKPDHKNRFSPWFKPDWSPDTLYSFFYLGSMVAIRKSAFESFVFTDGSLAEHTGNQNNDGFSRLYDFILQAAGTLETKQTIHLPYVLSHRRLDTEDSQVADQWMLGAEMEYLPLRKTAWEKRGISVTEVETMYPEIVSLYPRTNDMNDKISIVILSKDNPKVLRKCITSLREKTALHSALEIIVVDNGSREENRDLVEQMASELGFIYDYHPMEFNFSALCNYGASKAVGNLLLFLNDDVEAVEQDWLDIMAGWAKLPHVGAVGAKLWYPGGEQIQHAGITNQGVGPSHKLVTFQDDQAYYHGHNMVPYDMICVTGACLLVKKEVFDRIGGFDETMKVSYNDVDLCFRLWELGLQNVQCNDAVLVHHESLSRGLDEDTPEKWERLLTEKENLYKKHPLLFKKDPYYSQSLNQNLPDYRCDCPFLYENQLYTLPVDLFHDQVEKYKSTFVMPTVERAFLQHKIHKSEPDIYMIEGWSYMLGMDNARFDTSLILTHESGETLCVKALKKYRFDVEAILPAQKNISLAGFVVRILKENLKAGNYRIGILHTDRQSGALYYQEVTKTMGVN